MNKSYLIIRLIPGLVFLSEGIQKFILPELVGAGRFSKLGFNNPVFWAGFTGAFEILCGVMLLIGLFTRWVTIPLLVIMAVAILQTKVPTLLEKGFWITAHEGRTDFAITMLLIFIFLNGAGPYSLDEKRRKNLRNFNG